MDAALRHGIIEQSLAPEQPGHRAGIDDRRAGLHLCDRGLRHVEVTIKVGLQGLIEVLGSEILELRRVDLECGVVDENIERAELFDRPRHRPLAKVLTRNVARDEDAFPSLGLHAFPGHRGIALLVLQIDDGDIRAFSREQDRYGAADAGIAACDERRFVVKLAGTAIKRRVIHRSGVQLGFLPRLALMLFGKRRNRVFARAGLHRLFRVFFRPATVRPRDLSLYKALPMLRTLVTHWMAPCSSSTDLADAVSINRPCGNSAAIACGRLPLAVSVLTGLWLVSGLQLKVDEPNGFFRIKVERMRCPIRYVSNHP